MYCKGSANRREYKINSFIFILEVPPTFTAGAVNSANRSKYIPTLFIYIPQTSADLLKPDFGV